MLKPLRVACPGGASFRPEAKRDTFQSCRYHLLSVVGQTSASLGCCSLSGESLNWIAKTALALMFSETAGHGVDEEEVIRPGSQPGPPRQAASRPH